jgi:glyoxylase-like metal-dependent hydrolase (beta-lactamase superfamily II)
MPADRPLRLSPRNVVSYALLACASAFSCLAPAEVTSPVLAINAEAATAPITVRPLRGNVSLVMGSGGNITVLNNRAGKLLGDSGIAVSRPRLEAALATIGPEPLRYVINTHYHWDHTDGNAWMNQLGATIVAHENTRKRLASGQRVIEWGYTFPPVTGPGLPTEVFQTEKRIQFGEETVILRNFGTGHTDGDTAIHYVKADVLQIGDIWWNGYYPFLDNGGGGSIDGLIRWVNECIKLASEKTIIVPGHGEPSNRAALTEFRDMLVTVRANVASLKKDGKTLSETIAARPTAAFDERYGKFLIGAMFFVQLVYTGV